MTLEGTSGGVAGRSGDSHPAEQGSWKDDPLADPFPPSFDGASTWPDASDERGEPALGSRGVTFADESPLPNLDRPPLPTSPERSEVLPQSRHGKNLRRALRCGLCTAVFCSLVGSVLLLEALLLATDSVSAGGSNVTLEYARKSLRSKMDNVVVTSACFLCLLMLAGHQLRRTSRVLRALHLPASGAVRDTSATSPRHMSAGAPPPRLGAGRLRRLGLLCLRRLGRPSGHLPHGGLVLGD